MGFNPSIREAALIACKRHCVWCELSQGITVECHHIVPQSEGGDDTFDNCIPLCLNCHGIVGGSYNSKHPRGTKVSASELKQRRDMFYERVKRNEIPVIKTHVPTQKSPNKYDIELYEKIENLFSAPNLEYYLNDCDLGNDFENKIFQPLWEFSFMMNNPTSVFIDAELEHLKKVLVGKVDRFNTYKATNTFPTSFGTQALRCWKNEDYTYEESRRIINEFNDLASSVWDAYSQLIITCRRNLS